MRARYHIDVRAKRGDQPSYTFAQYRGVKPGKVQRLIDKTAIDLAQHEGRGDFMPSFLSLTEDEDGYIPVQVVVGSNVFVVVPTPAPGKDLS